MRNMFLLAVMSGSLCAADHVSPGIADVRLGFVTSLDYEQETSYSESGGIVRNVNADVLGLRLTYVRNVTALGQYGGAFAGGSVSWDHIEASDKYEGDPIDTKTKLLGFVAQGGYAFVCPTNPRYHTEVALEVGYYIGKQDRFIEAAQVPATFSGFGYDVRLGSYYLFSNNIQLGVELTYVIERDLNGYPEDQPKFFQSDESHKGWLLGVTLGTRL